MHRIASDRRYPSGLMRLFAVWFAAGGLFAVSIILEGRGWKKRGNSLNGLKRKQKHELVDAEARWAFFFFFLISCF